MQPPRGALWLFASPLRLRAGVLLLALLALSAGAAWNFDTILKNAEQRYGDLGAAKTRLGDWGRLLEQGGTLDEMAKLKAVNAFFNGALRVHRRPHRDLAPGGLLGHPGGGALQGRRRLRGLRHRQVRDPAPPRRRQRQAAHHLRQGPAPEPGAHGADLVRLPGCRPAGAGQPDRRRSGPPPSARTSCPFTPSTPRASGCPAPAADAAPATARSCRAGRTC